MLLFLFKYYFYTFFILFFYPSLKKKRFSLGREKCLKKNATHPPKFISKIIKIYFSFESKKDFVYEVILEFFNRFFKYSFRGTHPQKKF
jgi:hypothetical protein